MKKLILGLSLFLVIAVALGFGYCGGGSTLPGGQDVSGDCDHFSGQTVPVGYGPFETPSAPSGFEWVMSGGGGLGTEDGVQVMYVIGEHDSTYRENAMEVARTQVMGQIADAIKSQVIHQVARATETLGVGANEDMEAVTRTLTAVRSTAEIHGAIMKDSIIVKMREIGRVNPETCAESNVREFYRVFVRFYLPYDLYVQMRDGLFQQVRQQLPNNNAVSLLEDAVTDLDEGREPEPVQIEEPVQTYTPAPTPTPVVPTPAAVRPERREVVQRTGEIEGNLGGTGDIRVRLRWPQSNSADMDLHVTLPNGTEVYWDNKNDRETQAYLDIDDLGTSNTQIENGYHVENFYVSQGQAPCGMYTVEVNAYSLNGDRNVPAIVEVQIGDTVSSFNQSFSQADQRITIHRFHYSGCSNQIVSSSGPSTLVIDNRSGETLFYLYCSSSSSSDWGNDWFGSEVLTAGNTFTVDNRFSQGEYDILLEDLSGNTIDEVYNVNFPGGQVTWIIYGRGNSNIIYGQTSSINNQNNNPTLPVNPPRYNRGGNNNQNSNSGRGGNIQRR